MFKTLSPKYKKISPRKIIIKKNGIKRITSSRIQSDRIYSILLRKKLLLINNQKNIKESSDNKSLINSLNYSKEKYDKIKQESKTLETLNKATKKLYKQNINITFNDLIQFYRDKKYNITIDNINKNIFKKHPLLLKLKRNKLEENYIKFHSELISDKHIKFIEKEKNIINLRKDNFKNKKEKINLYKGSLSEKKIENFKTLDRNVIKRINLRNKFNIKNNSKSEKDIIKNSYDKNIFFSFNKNSRFKPYNKKYKTIKISEQPSTKSIKQKKETKNILVKNLLKEKNKSNFLESLQKINILFLPRNDLELIIEYYAKNFMNYNPTQIKKIFITKTSIIDMQILSILNFFMEKNKEIKNKNKYINNFEIFDNIKKVDNTAFKLQQKLIENQTE